MMSFVDCEMCSGNLMSNDTSKSPRLDGSFGKGNPLPCILLTVFGLITSLAVFTVSSDPPSNGTFTELPHSAFFKVTLAVYRISLPSRLNVECGLSRMMNTISAGILFGIRSPSPGNVILVPLFQPKRGDKNFMMLMSKQNVLLDL